MTLLALHFDEVTIRIALRRTPTAHALLKAVPFESTIQTRGAQVLFDCPIRVTPEDKATNIVQPGDIAFWSDGSCLAIAFGKTPTSQGNEIRLSYPCNICGDALDEVTQLKSLKAGTRVRVEFAEG